MKIRESLHLELENSPDHSRSSYLALLQNRGNITPFINAMYSAHSGVHKFWSKTITKMAFNRTTGRSVNVNVNVNVNVEETSSH